MTAPKRYTTSFRRAAVVVSGLILSLTIQTAEVYAADGAAEELVIEVREVSGIARAGSPVAYRLESSRAVPKATPFALLDEKGEPVIAQFSPAAEGPMPAAWWLDFNAELKPWETRRYTVRFGEGVRPGSEGKSGHQLEETERFYKITNAPYITWTVPRDLAGLLRSVDFPPNEHLLPDSRGLVLRDREGREHILGAGFHAGRVIRNGRRAVALRFTGEAKAEALAGVRSTVDLVFPSPVSWVEVDWTIDDPQDRVSGMDASLRTALDAPRPDSPTLVDFGASTWVYARLAADQSAELQAPAPAESRAPGEPAWRVLRGPVGSMTPFAVGSPARGERPDSVRAEGWAHIMDRRRCLALAVDHFGQEAAERILLTGNGEVTMSRDAAPKSGAPRVGAKRLHFWLHFVFYPPQHSAATSPRMMQTPPQITTLKPSATGALPAK
jgi:hypothetical protein